MDTSTSPVCPACRGKLILRRVPDLNVVEYRARCPGCQWARWLRELRCGGCHEHRLFEWTGGAWRCLRCCHVRGDQSPPRALDGYEFSEPRGLKMDIVETPPRRGPWSRGEAAGVILEAIPCDRWMSAAEIAAETGISSRRVAGIIREKLLDADVERRLTRSSGCLFYLYRRLTHVGTSRRTLAPDGAPSPTIPTVFLQFYLVTSREVGLLLEPKPESDQSSAYQLHRKLNPHGRGERMSSFRTPRRLRPT